MTVLTAAPARAQRAVGPWDDAWLIPSGALRIGLSPNLLSARERFGTSGAESLGAPFARTLNTDGLPTLSAFDAAINALSGTTGFQSRLGVSTADVRLTAATVPLEVSFGITRRIMLRALIPYNTGQNEIQLKVDGTDATLGLNPAVFATTTFAANGAIATSLTDAATSLEALAAACALSAASDTRCTLINAESSDVLALIAAARATGSGVLAVYGGATDTKAPILVPLASSAAQNAIMARIAALSSGFARYGTPTTLADGAAPLGALAPPTLTELTTLLRDSTYGYVFGPLNRRYLQGFGDIDVGVSLLLFDGTHTPDSWVRRDVSALAFRETVGFTYRLGTGTPPDPDDLLRVPTGDGQDDLEFVSSTDIIGRGHAWASVTGRYTKQMPRDGIARIPDASGSPFVPLTRRRFSRTTLGDRIGFDVTPRWALNDRFGAGLRYRFTHQAATTIEELPPFAGAAPMTFTGESMTAHEVGFGLVWSSINAWHAGHTGWPIEIEWTHSMVIAGSGGVAKLSGDRISFRAFAKLWGR
ncbi:MAG TPA: hypothetical protein VE967_14625 [Gemmatimonadaceae bacterium]|nr:hypothetical protein [Gemmatimonadaceae bacterium]